MRCGVAGIAKRVQLFNDAYRTGWELLKTEEQPYAPEMAIRLKDNISTLIRAGWDDPQEIARTTAERIRHHRRDLVRS